MSVVGDGAIQIARGPFGVAAIVVSAGLFRITGCVEGQITGVRAHRDQHCCQAGNCYGDK